MSGLLMLWILAFLVLFGTTIFVVYKEMKARREESSKWKEFQEWKKYEKARKRESDEWKEFQERKECEETRKREPDEIEFEEKNAKTR